MHKATTADGPARPAFNTMVQAPADRQLCTCKRPGYSASGGQGKSSRKSANNTDEAWPIRDALSEWENGARRGLEPLGQLAVAKRFSYRAVADGPTFGPTFDFTSFIEPQAR